MGEARTQSASQSERASFAQKGTADEGCDEEAADQPSGEAAPGEATWQWRQKEQAHGRGNARHGKADIGAGYAAFRRKESRYARRAQENPDQTEAYNGEEWPQPIHQANRQAENVHRFPIRR